MSPQTIPGASSQLSFTFPNYTEFCIVGKALRGSDSCSELCLEDGTCSEEIGYTGLGTNVSEWQVKTFRLYRISYSYPAGRHASFWDSFFAVRPVAATVLYGSDFCILARNIHPTGRINAMGGKLRVFQKAVAVTLLFVYLLI